MDFVLKQKRSGNFISISAKDSFVKNLTLQLIINLKSFSFAVKNKKYCSYFRSVLFFLRFSALKPNMPMELGALIIRDNLSQRNDLSTDS